MKFVRLCYRSQWAILTILAVTMIHGGACTTYPVRPQPSELKNTAPVIHILKAPKQVAPSSISQISCVATSENDDDLVYQWSATGGQIQGEADSIVWIAPDTTGDCTITVTVSDGEGNNTTSAAHIIVTLRPNRAPVVDSMTCLNCSNGIEASRWSQYQIRCDASDLDGDKLNYMWLATIGKIEGDGPYATWLTLGQYGNALITVIVTDDKGNETEGYLAINISCCH